jgi:hypothetical protein
MDSRSFPRSSFPSPPPALTVLVRAWRLEKVSGSVGWCSGCYGLLGRRIWGERDKGRGMLENAEEKEGRAELPSQRLLRRPWDEIYVEEVKGEA